MSPADSTIIIRDQILKVRLAAHRGRVIFDIRFHYQPANGGNLKPGKRGITLPADTLPEIIDALEALKAQLIHDGFMEVTGENRPPKFHPHVYSPDF